ncbi:MAG TPA: hypothetical protein VML75_26900 [Kofleriaceae bacterium]|nr:hypothetical protein [Kofleriaceae bacterium]
MKTYQYSGEAFETARSHPWTDAVASSGFRYHDLRAEPALIRTSLEDFAPWAAYPAVERFYLLLEWLNGASSTLESNDCAFTAAQPSENPQFPRSLECSGRVMVLFRDLVRNIAPHDLLSLTQGLHHTLAITDPDFELGVVASALIPVRYVTLPVDPDAQLGTQLMISFWAWGSTDAETMANLDRLMKNLSHALRTVAS